MGKAIGKKLPFGFRGSVTRTPDTIIAPYANVGAENIQFGEPVVYDPDAQGVRKVAAGDTADKVIGIAVRRIGQPYADNEQGWYYAEGDTVDVLLRGSIAVELADATGIAGRGKVYVKTGADTAGNIVCASAADAIEVPNAVFATGECDASNIAEVTILARSI